MSCAMKKDGPGVLIMTSTELGRFFVNKVYDAVQVLAVLDIDAGCVPTSKIYF